MRLTKRTKGSIYMYNFDTNCDNETREQRSIETHNKIVNKLGVLEDIEEEYGIDLITVFKAMKNGVWTKNIKQGIHFISLISWNCEVSRISGKLSLLFSFNVWEGNEEDADDTIYFLKDYGKTWALTREELEK